MAEGRNLPLAESKPLSRVAEAPRRSLVPAGRKHVPNEAGLRPEGCQTEQSWTSFKNVSMTATSITQGRTRALETGRLTARISPPPPPPRGSFTTTSTEMCLRESRQPTARTRGVLSVMVPTSLPISLRAGLCSWPRSPVIEGKLTQALRS